MRTVFLHAGWSFREAGEELWHAATVPGCVHLDLMAAGEMSDPFVRDHEAQVQDVGRKDWEYRLRFDVPPRIRGEEHVSLVFDGLDTYAGVRLNGETIIEADNMFRPWQADVKQHLRAKDNELAILFRSPVKEVERRLQGAPYRLASPNDAAGGTRPYTRKAQYHYGWDWGPCLVTAGIWRAVRLEAWSRARIADLQVRQQALTGEHAELDVAVEIESAEACDARLAVSVDGVAAADRQVHLSAGRDTVRLAVRIPSPRLWWPAGSGEQNLYTVRVELDGGGATDAAQRRIGLRTIEVRRAADAGGESFAFVVNGRPIFAKGANWIPADTFTPRVTRAQYRDLIEGARDANMNMLRVWGGGIYEHDAFYDLCDELGLLVWQDFMFVCALYPGDDAFLASVRGEADYQVRRLRHHPSLALWCGNNENEWGWTDWGWKQQFPASVFDDYKRLFDGLLPEVCEREDPGRLYWPSSPASAGRTTEKANDPARGDMHIWDVWGDPQAAPERYEQHRPRFASEFGFQAFPEPRTVAAYAEPGERAPGSPVMLVHQKAPQGNDKITGHVARMFGAARDDDSFFWLSQLVQAEAVRIGVEHFRRLRPHCMGALYWQIDDCWPVASWSSIDYFGRWKALHYAARRFFAPVLVSWRRSGDRAEVWVVSDRAEDATATLRVRLADFGGRTLRTWRRSVRVPASSSVAYLEIDFSRLPPHDPSATFLVAELGEGRRRLARASLRFVEPRGLRLGDPGLVVSVRTRGRRAIADVKAQAYAPVVILEADGEGRFEDNFFELLPGETRRVKFVPRTRGEGPGRVRARSLADLVRVTQGPSLVRDELAADLS